MMEGKMAGERFFRFVDGAADEIVLCDSTLVAFFKRYGGDAGVARVLRGGRGLRVEAGGRRGRAGAGECAGAAD